MPELTDDELIQSCHEFVLQQQELQLEEPKPEPEWTGSLTITPDMVADILLSNNEE
jgi:hypothetical protein